MSEAIRRYRLLPEGLAAAQQRVRARYLIPQLVLFAGIMLLGFFLAARRDPNLRFVVPYAIAISLLLTYIAFVSPRRLRRNLNKGWDSYLLEIGPDYLLRTQADTPDLRLPFSEIRAIEHYPGRFLRVHGTTRQRVLGIPKDIEQFPEIFSTLAAIRPITETRSDRSLKSFLLILVTMAAFMGMAWSTSPRIVIPLAVFVIGVVLWTIVMFQRSPNASHRAKRQSWFYLILVGVCILKLLLLFGLI